MPSQKCQRARELARIPAHIHAEPLTKGCRNQPRTKKQVTPRENGRKQVIRRHHLGARIRLERLEDVVLRAIGQTIKQQVNTQQEHAPGRLAAMRRKLLFSSARVQRKYRDTAGNSSNDKVLVERIALAEDGDMQEHDGEQFAALCKNKGDIVDMRKRGIPKRSGEGIRKGDEKEGREDLAVGNHGGDGLSAGRGKVCKEQSAGAGKEGLNGEEEDGELEALARGAVGGCGQLFLEKSPCQAFNG